MKAEDKFKVYKQKAEKGDAEAQADLGYCYQYGKGVAVDMEQARRYYQLSADNGNATGQARLGFYYASREGGAIDDLKKGLQLLNQSVEQKNPIGLNNLAVCYVYGYFFSIGIKAAFKEAEQLYIQAANLGCAIAKKNLAKIYTDFYKITKENLKKAKKLLQPLADEGDEEAKQELEKIFSKESKVDTAVVSSPDQSKKRRFSALAAQVLEGIEFQKKIRQGRMMQKFKDYYYSHYYYSGLKKYLTAPINNSGTTFYDIPLTFKILENNLRKLLQAITHKLTLDEPRNDEKQELKVKIPKEEFIAVLEYCKKLDIQTLIAPIFSETHYSLKKGIKTPGDLTFVLTNKGHTELFLKLGGYDEKDEDEDEDWSGGRKYGRSIYKIADSANIFLPCVSYYESVRIFNPKYPHHNIENEKKGYAITQKINSPYIEDGVGYVSKEEDSQESWHYISLRGDSYADSVDPYHFLTIAFGMARTFRLIHNKSILHGDTFLHNFVIFHTNSTPSVAYAKLIDWEMAEKYSPENFQKGLFLHDWGKAFGALFDSLDKYSFESRQIGLKEIKNLVDEGMFKEFSPQEKELLIELLEFFNFLKIFEFLDSDTWMSTYKQASMCLNGEMLWRRMAEIFDKLRSINSELNKRLTILEKLEYQFEKSFIRYVAPSITQTLRRTDGLSDTQMDMLYQLREAKAKAKAKLKPQPVVKKKNFLEPHFFKIPSKKGADSLKTRGIRL
jgi:TPR repeat protein